MTGGPRFAELFAGAGGLSLGLERAGWSCAWHAEIDAAPRAILKHRWPDVPLYGDVLTLDGRELTRTHGAIDLLSGGSPCQDLSVAGKRAGMTEGSGTRSSLFFEQMRLWDETGADLCLWENVDGARSSNEGKDFGAVLRAFVGATVPVPSDGWRSAGVAAGPVGVAAWRVLDAQFFGVPQRRRRVFVLGTRSGRVDPAEILSLAESVRGDSPKGREAGEGFTRPVDEGTEPAGRIADTITANYGKQIGSRDSSKGPPNLILDALNSTTDDIAHSLRSNMDRASGYGAVVSFQEVGKRTGKSTTDIRAGVGISEPDDPMYTLQAGAQHGVIAFGQQNSAAQGASAKCAPTLDKSKVPGIVAFAFGSHSGSDGEATNISHASGGPVGFGLNEELSPAIRAGRTQAICVTGEVTHGLTHEGSDASQDGTGRGTPIVANTTTAREQKGWNPARDVGNGPVAHGIPRRLTPRECERLMGWPDDHTLVPDANGKLLSDAARYKAAGNGVACVHSHWIGWRLMLALHPAPASPETALLPGPRLTDTHQP